nr:division/cell wall cluster transcriptional repressor MraZ [Rubellimicrobium sp. CFH 75288]
MSIPADFRKVLQAGDPDRAEAGAYRLQLHYGDHLQDRLEVRTVAAHRAIARRIAEWEPQDEEEEAEKDAAAHFLLTQSQSLEVDRDGRIVLPARFRARLGLTDGEVVFAGKGDRFEIWAAETYEVAVQARLREFLARKPKGYNPLTALSRRR